MGLGDILDKNIVNKESDSKGINALTNNSQNFISKLTNEKNTNLF